MSLGEKGITVRVLSEGEELKAGEDGCLGEELTDLRLECFIQGRKSLMPICFSVDGQKNITLMKNHSLDPVVSLFAQKVPVTLTDSGVLTTKYSTNNLRVATFGQGQTGRFEIWEIAIVSQDGLFFLTKQRSYESQFFRGKDGQILCPDFEKWPQLVEKLEPIMRDKKLLPISQYSPSPIPAEDLPQKQGRVIWWNLALQMGAIVLDKKGIAARVHWKHLLPNIDGSLRALKAGQLVSFQKLLPITNNGTRKTEFALEAQGVTPL